MDLALQKALIFPTQHQVKHIQNLLKPGEDALHIDIWSYNHFFMMIIIIMITINIMIIIVIMMTKTRRGRLTVALSRQAWYRLSNAQVNMLVTMWTNKIESSDRSRSWQRNMNNLYNIRRYKNRTMKNKQTNVFIAASRASSLASPTSPMWSASKSEKTLILMCQSVLCYEYPEWGKHWCPRYVINLHMFDTLQTAGAVERDRERWRLEHGSLFEEYSDSEKVQTGPVLRLSKHDAS